MWDEGEGVDRHGIDDRQESIDRASYDFVRSRTTCFIPIGVRTHLHLFLCLNVTSSGYLDTYQNLAKRCPCIHKPSISVHTQCNPIYTAVTITIVQGHRHTVSETATSPTNPSKPRIRSQQQHQRYASPPHPRSASSSPPSPH